MSATTGSERIAPISKSGGDIEIIRPAPGAQARNRFMVVAQGSSLGYSGRPSAVQVFVIPPRLYPKCRGATATCEEGAACDTAYIDPIFN